MAFSPDGKQLASGSGDATIKLWDLTADKEPRTLEGHAGGVYSVAFSPDGKQLASGSGDATTIKLWDLTADKEPRTLEGHAEGVWSVAFSPDGKQLASGSGDNTLKLWDIGLNELLVASCEWLQCYLNNPTADISDKEYIKSGCAQVLESEPQEKKSARQTRREFQDNMRWGNIHTVQGHYGQAIEKYQQALKHRPDIPRVWLEIAKTHEAFDHADLALKAYRRVVELNPGSEDGWYGLLYCLYSLDKLDEAQTKYRELFEKDEQFAERIIERVNDYFWVEDKAEDHLDKAAAAYATALQEDPGDLFF